MKKPALSRTLLKDWCVLIVDDEADSLAVAKYVLEFHSARVYTAREGVEGLRLAREHRPDFILSDLSMPIMDGWELLTLLKSDDDLAPIPVIALTAHAMTGDRERGLTAGFVGYMTKPFVAATLVPELLNLLERIPTLSGRIQQRVTP
jgi:CheY-like chemotaxis protein